MVHTPDLPFLHTFLARRRKRTRTRPVSAPLHGLSPGHLQARFPLILPDTLFCPPGSRKRTYTGPRTFWGALWQTLNGAADRCVVRHFQAALGVCGLEQICSGTSAWAQARARLPVEALEQALVQTAGQARRLAPLPQQGCLRGRPLLAVDGTTVTLPDTLENAGAFPKVQASTPAAKACTFPMVRVLAFFCVASGAILRAVHGSLRCAELRLLRPMLPHLRTGDILLGDRGFGKFTVLAWLRNTGVDFLGRSGRGARGRRIRRLGAGDWLVRWERSPGRSVLLSPQEWKDGPKELEVRIIEGTYAQRGFRLRRVVLVTTLLDPQAYPAQELLAAYGRRWRLEMCLDDLKTTLGMEMLSWKTPAMIHKEILLHLIGHNLVRIVMAEAAAEHPVELERLSFKGSLDALIEFCAALGSARTGKCRRRLHADLLKAIAEDRVPRRPGRREPRAVKRRKHKYPRLNTARAKFVDHPKRHERRRRAAQSIA